MNEKLTELQAYARMLNVNVEIMNPWGNEQGGRDYTIRNKPAMSYIRIGPNYGLTYNEVIEILNELQHDELRVYFSPR